MSLFFFDLILSVIFDPNFYRLCCFRDRFFLQIKYPSLFTKPTNSSSIHQNYLLPKPFNTNFTLCSPFQSTTQFFRDWYKPKKTKLPLLQVTNFDSAGNGGSSSFGRVGTTGKGGNSGLGKVGTTATGDFSSLLTLGIFGNSGTGGNSTCGKVVFSGAQGSSGFGSSGYSW